MKNTNSKITTNNVKNSNIEKISTDDLDDALKELEEQYKKYNLDNVSKELDEQIKLLKEEKNKDKMN